MSLALYMLKRQKLKTYRRIESASASDEAQFNKMPHDIKMLGKPLIT